MAKPAPTLGKLTPLIPAGKDLQAALNFYEQKLGFTVTYQDDSSSMAIIQRSEIEIILLNQDDPHTASQTSFRIQLSDVNALYEEYRAQGIAPFELAEGAGLTTLRVTPWGTKEFAVRDLAGVCITFYERLA